MGQFYKNLKSFLCEKLAEFNTFTSEEGNYVYIYRWILYQQGFWPALDKATKTPPSRIRYWNARLALAFWGYVTLIGFPMAAYTSAGEPFLVLVELIIQSFLTAIGTAISGSLIYQSDLFQETVESFEAMKKCASLLPERAHKNTWLRKNICDAVFKFFFVAWILVICVCALSLPFLIPTKSLIWRAWYPYNEKAWPFYEVTLAGWNAFFILGAAFVFPSSTLLVTFLVQAWSHLELLCHNLTMLRESSLKRTSKILNFGTWQKRGQEYYDEVNNEMAIVLQNCVLHHQAIVRFVSLLGPTFDLMLTQILLGFLIISGLFIVSIQHLDHFKVTTLCQLVALICMATIMLLTFLIADKVMDQSEMVGDSAFGCDWLEAPASLKRSLWIIMSFSNQPLVITVTGGIPLSLETCRELFILTYKFYTFMIESTSTSGS